MAKKNLIIVESPGKVKTISSYLTSDFAVMASIGHIRLLDKSGKHKLGVDVDGDFSATYVNDPDKKDVIKGIKAAADAAETIYLASDADLEGEAISWHLSEVVGKKNAKKLVRITFNEITKKAIQEALKHGRQIDMKKVDAQETRRILDRIVGFRLSGLAISKVGGKSAGRVQSAALKIVVDREREIIAFVPEEYFEIYLPFTKDSKEYKAKYKGTDKKKMVSIPNQATADAVVKACKAGDYSVGDIKQKERSVPSRPPYITSTFQQDASAKLGFGSKRAMMAAQKLYEGKSIEGTSYGLITYMRTDSNRLSDDFTAEAKKHILANYGKEYHSGTVSQNKKSGQENVQDAHEAIRPTHLEFTPERVKPFLELDELKVYTLIYNRSLAALMTNATIKDTEAVIFNGDHRFGISGHEIVFDGFMKLYTDHKDEEEEDDRVLPPFKIGEKIKDKPLVVEKKFTSPLSRYTEANLIKRMEELGIGRPSTYASIMDTLTKRDYTEKQGKMLVPTKLGMNLIDMTDSHFTGIINTTYTAEMETKLDDISEGKLDKLKELKAFYKEFEPLIKKAKDEYESKKEKPIMTDKVCVKCSKPMLLRTGKFGQFYACSGYPKCKHTEKFIDPNAAPAAPKAPAVDTGVVCPVCNEGHLVERTSTKGKSAGSKFYACNKFPKCKTTFSAEKFAADFGAVTPQASPKFTSESTDSDLD
jgi:DNA topoisomerase-1